MNLRDIPARRAGQIHRRAARVHQQRQRQQLQVPMANNNQLYSDLKHIQVTWRTRTTETYRIHPLVNGSRTFRIGRDSSNISSGFS